MKQGLLTCLLLAVLLMTADGGATAEPPWASFCANSARTLQSTCSGPGDDIELLLSASALGPGLHLTPPAAAVAANGSVFTVSDKLYGYDSNGTNFLTANLAPDSGFGTGPMLSDGLVSAGLVNYLHTFDATGARVGTWTAPYPERELSFRPGALAPGDRLILPVGSALSPTPCLPSEADILCILPNGEIEWELFVETLLSPPAVSANGKVFFSADDPVLAPFGKALVCVGPDGSFVWRFNRPVRDLPAVNDDLGMVLVRAGSENGDDESVAALDIETGTQIWEFRPPEPYSYPFYGASEPYWCWVKALALDVPRGLTYAFWDANDGGWQLMTAIGPGGELMWSWERRNTYDCRYASISHPVLDADGVVYLVSSYSQFTVEDAWTTVYSIEALDHNGNTLGLYEHKAEGTGYGWGALEPAIGPDRRLYLFAADIDSADVFSPPWRLYIFGPSGPDQTDMRPSILSAGYGLSRVTAGVGGALAINATVSHPLGVSNIDAVEVRLGGVPTGVCLLPNGSEGQYDVTIDVPAGFIPAGQFLLELVARDKEGRTSDVWPYMTVAVD